MELIIICLLKIEVDIITNFINNNTVTSNLRINIGGIFIETYVNNLQGKKYMKMSQCISIY